MLPCFKRLGLDLYRHSKDTTPMCTIMVNRAEVDRGNVERLETSCTVFARHRDVHLYLASHVAPSPYMTRRLERIAGVVRAIAPTVVCVHYCLMITLSLHSSPGRCETQAMYLRTATSIG